MTQKNLKAGNDYTESQKSIASECTYGKGINPEGVEKMKAVLEHLLTLEAFKKRFPFLATLSEEALTAAKL
jgi:hypothetical protein